MGHDDLRALTESQALSATGESAALKHPASGNLGPACFLFDKSLDRAVWARTIQRQVKIEVTRTGLDAPIYRSEYYLPRPKKK